MAFKPEDVQKPRAVRSKAGAARVKAQNLTGRLTQVKDPGTAEAMGKIAGQLQKQGSTIRDRARQTRQNHDELSAQMSDSAARVGRAERSAIDSKSKSELRSAEATTADVQRTTQQDMLNVAEKNFVGAYISPEDDGMADFVKVAGAAVAVAGALQDSRKDMEKGIKEQQLKLRYAQVMAQEGPRILQAADGTPDGVINSDSMVADVGEQVLKDVYGDHYLQQDPEAMAAAQKILMGLRTSQLSTIATQNHNNQMGLAKKEVEAIIQQHGSLALKTGEWETSLLNLQELKPILIEQGAMNELDADTALKAGGTLIVGNAVQYLKENNRFDEAFALTERTQGEFKGADEASNLAYDQMVQRGMDPFQTFGILFFESGMNPNAKNPRGTASGIAQQIQSTWKEGYKQTFGYYPRAGSLARDYPVEIQAQVGLKVLADEQEKLRNYLGVPALSDSQAYMAHFKNAKDAYEILKFKPNTSLDLIPFVTPKEVRDNGWTKNGRTFTVGELERWAAKKVMIGRQRAQKAGVIVANGDLAQFVTPSKAAQWNASITTAQQTFINNQLKLQQAITDAVTHDPMVDSPKNDPAGAINAAVPHMGQMYSQVQEVYRAQNEDGSRKFSIPEQAKVYQEYAEKMHIAQQKAYSEEYGGSNPPALFYKYLPKSEASAIAARFKGAEGHVAAEMFDAERERWGEYWPSVSNQVAQEAKSGEFEVAMMFDRWGDPTGWTNLTGVMNVSMDQIEKGMPPGAALKGKSEDSVETLVAVEMDGFRQPLMPPQVTGQVAGNLFDNMKQVATKMAGRLMQGPEGFDAQTAARMVREDFERNLKYIDDPRVRVAMTTGTLAKEGLSMDQIQTGIDTVFDLETATELLETELMGVGDPNESKPLRQPRGRLAQGSLDMGDYITSGDGKTVPPLSVDEIAPNAFAVSAPGDKEGHYGIFTTAENASSYALALKNRAREMLTFDREQTLENFSASGMVTSSANQAGIELLVRTGGSRGYSPMYNMAGEPIVIPWKDLVKLGER